MLQLTENRFKSKVAKGRQDPNLERAVPDTLNSRGQVLLTERQPINKRTFNSILRLRECTRPKKGEGLIIKIKWRNKKRFLSLWTKFSQCFPSLSNSTSSTSAISTNMSPLRCSSLWSLSCIKDCRVPSTASDLRRITEAKAKLTQPRFFSIHRTASIPHFHQFGQ